MSEPISFKKPRSLTDSIVLKNTDAVIFKDAEAIRSSIERKPFLISKMISYFPKDQLCSIECSNIFYRTLTRVTYEL